jgi:hypothetical protein
MRTLFCTFVLAVLLACGGGDKAAAPKTMPGTYPLVSYAGSGMPATIVQVPGYKAELTGGTITLNANGSFSNSYSFRETEGTTVTNTTIPCSGTWAQSGNAVALQETVAGDCGDTGTASWDGNNTLTINWENLGGPTVHRR